MFSKSYPLYTSDPAVEARCRELTRPIAAEAYRVQCVATPLLYIAIAAVILSFCYKNEFIALQWPLWIVGILFIVALCFMGRLCYLDWRIAETEREHGVHVNQCPGVM